MNVNLDEKLTKHFTMREALWLPTWIRAAHAGDGLTDQVIANLCACLSRVDEVLDHFSWQAIVHCCYRPAKYNELVRGAPNSAHLANRAGVAALDFHVKGVDCESARQRITAAGLLDKLGLRMEENGPMAAWIHLDSAPVPPGGHRYFKP